MEQYSFGNPTNIINLYKVIKFELGSQEDFLIIIILFIYFFKIMGKILTMTGIF